MKNSFARNLVGYIGTAAPSMQINGQKEKWNNYCCIHHSVILQLILMAKFNLFVRQQRRHHRGNSATFKGHHLQWEVAPHLRSLCYQLWHRQPSGFTGSKSDRSTTIYSCFIKLYSNQSKKKVEWTSLTKNLTFNWHTMRLLDLNI